jgi:putative flippase GtrA
MNWALNQIAAAWRSRTIIAKLFSFATIGVLNVAVDFTVFSIAYALLDLPLVLSNVIAWAVAVSGSYAMNTKVTFGRETGGAFSWKHYLSFAASGVLGVIVATTTLVILSQHTNVFVAKFISILAAFGVNFSMSHFVVFRAVRPNPKPL